MLGEVEGEVGFITSWSLVPAAFQLVKFWVSFSFGGKVNALVFDEYLNVVRWSFWESYIETGEVKFVSSVELTGDFVVHQWVDDGIMEIEFKSFSKKLAIEGIVSLNGLNFSISVCPVAFPISFASHGSCGESFLGVQSTAEVQFFVLVVDVEFVLHLVGLDSPVGFTVKVSVLTMCDFTVVVEGFESEDRILFSSGLVQAVLGLDDEWFGNRGMGDGNELVKK